MPSTSTEGSSSPTRDSRRRRQARLVLLGALVLAALLRVGIYPARTFEGQVVLGQVDSQYHFKRLLYTVRHFPHILQHDPDAPYPGGAWHIWPPLFAWLGAAPVWAWSGPDAPLFQVQWGAALVAPGLGLLAVAAAWALGSVLRGPPTAAVAAVATALHPLLIDLSAFGYFDHHAVQPPLVLASLWLVLTPGLSARTAGTLLGGVWTVAILCDRTSLLMPLLFIAASFGAHLLMSHLEPADRAMTRRIALGCLVMAPFLLLAITGWHSVPGRAALRPAHPLVLGVAGATLWIVGRGSGRARAWRLTTAGGLVGLVVAARAIADIVAFSSADPHVTTTPEFRSLLSDFATFRWMGWRLTPSVLLLPWLLRGRRGAAVMLLAVTAAVPLALGVLQLRYTWTLAALPPVALALVVRELFDRRRVALLALLVFLHLPSWARPVHELVTTTHDTWLGIAPDPWDPYRGARWLAEHRNGGVVLSYWRLGHLMNVTGRKPVYVDGQGSMENGRVQRHARFLLETSPDLARAFLERYDVRYVVTSPRLVSMLCQYVHRVRADYLGQDDTPTAELRRTLYWRLHYDGDAAYAARLGLTEVWTGRDAVPAEGGGVAPALRIWERKSAPAVGLELDLDP